MFEIGTATDHIDLLDRLDTFLTAKGSAFGLTYTGTGDGAFTGYSGGASSVAETFTITATSATSFDVVGSATGSIGPATVGTPFAHATIEFLITAGVTAFVAGDEFILSTAPKWITRRRALGCRVLATQSNTGTRAAQNLVDGKLVPHYSNDWDVSSPITIPQDIEFTFFEAETITDYEILGGSQCQIDDWTFDYWNGSTWVTLDTQIDFGAVSDGVTERFPIASPVSATRYRLHITDLTYSNDVNIEAVRLLRSDGIDAAFSQVIWEAPGNDGNSQIFVGIHAFERQDADYFDWELAGMDGYNATANLYQQPGFHGKRYLPLWDASIPYWFICDGRGFRVVAKISTQYEAALAGFLDAYFSPEQLPYPLVVGAPLRLTASIPIWSSTSYRWSNSTNQHRNPTHSDNVGESWPDADDYHLILRNLDGTWSGYESTSNDLATGTPTTSWPVHIVWPYRCGLSLLDPNLDGSHTLWPVVLNHDAPNTMGQLAGVRAVSGQGVTAETLVRLGQIDWLVLPNITRTDRDDWLAVALG